MAANQDYDYRVIDKRAVGKDVPFSVGIAIPVETHLIKEEPISEYVYLNVRTLFRAYHGSYNTTDRPNSTKLISGFIQELSDLKAFIEALGYMPVVYACAHKKLSEYLPDSKPKEPKTELQKEYARLELLSIASARRENLVDAVFNNVLQGSNKGRTVIMTHIPSDLLSQYNFGELMLLETQTGEIKTRSQWSSKLGITKDEAKRMPFNILTLQVLGDKSKLFMSTGIKDKKALLELAKKRKWNSMTTINKVKRDLTLLDKNFADRFNRMITAKLR